MHKRILIIIASIAILIIALVLIFNQANMLSITEYNFAFAAVKNDITFVHLSDLHGKDFGNNNSRLIEMVRQQKPDLIFFTGDLINSYDKKSYDLSIKTIASLNNVAPVYYINGNHEYRIDYLDELIQKLKENNITVLQNEMKTVTVKGTVINILGLDEKRQNADGIIGNLKNLESQSGLKILLSHYPENFSLNKKYKFNTYKIDLVLSGHTHGGQIALPYIGAVLAPGQDLFPKYGRGLYTENGVNLIVNRGLGTTEIPIRICSKPEIGVIKVISR